MEEKHQNNGEELINSGSTAEEVKHNSDSTMQHDFGSTTEEVKRTSLVLHGKMVPNSGRA